MCIIWLGGYAASLAFLVSLAWCHGCDQLLEISAHDNLPWHFFFNLILSHELKGIDLWMDALAELSWQTPSAAIVTVAAYSVANRLCIGHTYIVLLWQDVLPSRLTAALTTTGIYLHIYTLPLILFGKMKLSALKNAYTRVKFLFVPPVKCITLSLHRYFNDRTKIIPNEKIFKLVTQQSYCLF